MVNKEYTQIITICCCVFVECLQVAIHIKSKVLVLLESVCVKT